MAKKKIMRMRLTTLNNGTYDNPSLSKPKLNKIELVLITGTWSFVVPVFYNDKYPACHLLKLFSMETPLREKIIVATSA